MHWQRSIFARGAILAAVVIGSGCRIGFDLLEGSAGPQTDAMVDQAPPPDAPIDVPASSLMMRLDMEDDPSDGAADMSGHGHAAACVTGCPTHVQGYDGMGYGGWSSSSVPGLQLPDSPELRLTQFTLAAWVKLSSGADNAAVIAKPYGTQDFDSYELIIDSNQHAVCSIAGTGGQTSVEYTTPLTKGQGDWYHVACTFDGAALRLYVGKTLVAGPVSGSSIDFEAKPVYVGSDRNGGSAANTFDGVLDEVRIYSKPLDNDEILQIVP